MLVGLEVGEKPMNVFLSDLLSHFPLYPLIAMHLAAGVVLGIVFFRALWWQTRLLAQGAAVSKIVMVMASRLLLLAGLLALASMEGATMLISMAIGVILGRQLAIRRFEKSDA